MIDDPAADHARVTRARALPGEDLLRHRRARGRAAATTVAVAPARAALSVPGRAGRRAARRYPNLREIVWAQEEPQNMGAWRSIRHRLEDAEPEGASFSTSAGRGARARARGIRPRTCASRTGIVRDGARPRALARSGRLPASRLSVPRRARLSSMSLAAFGPCLRASRSRASAATVAADARGRTASSRSRGGGSEFPEARARAQFAREPLLARGGPRRPRCSGSVASRARRRYRRCRVHRPRGGREAREFAGTVTGEGRVADRGGRGAGVRREPASGRVASPARRPRRRADRGGCGDRW